MRSVVLMFMLLAVARSALAEPSAQLGRPPTELMRTLTPPELNETSWVMIEVWPTVHDVTLTAYFLDFSFERNENLCAVAMRVFDRDPQEGQTTYRVCMPVTEARLREWFSR